MKRFILAIAALLTLLTFAYADELSVELSRLVCEQLAEAVNEQTDPWDKYLLEQNVIITDISEGQATAKVMSWDIGDTALDGEPAFDDLKVGLQSSFITGSISYSYDENGILSVSGTDAFIKKITAAASRANESFNSPSIRRVICSRILPEVYGDQGGFTNEYKKLLSQYSAIFPTYVLQTALLSQKPTTLNAENGPTAIQINVVHANIGALARNAYLSAYESLKNTDKSNAFPRERLNEILSACFVQTAASQSPDDFNTELSINFNMERLISGELTSQDFMDYAEQVTSVYSQKLDALEIAVGNLPDYPARNQPVTGVIKGPVSGTHVLFTAPDDGYGRIVSLLNASTFEPAVILFIRSGERVDAYIPSGKYLLDYGKGDEWYGLTKRFGEDAAYAASIVPIDILQSDKRHVISFIGEDTYESSGVRIPTRSNDYAEPN